MPLFQSKVINYGRKKIINCGVELDSLYVRPELKWGGAHGCEVLTGEIC